MAYISVIIASGGKSSRMNGINKQLLELDGVPVIIRSIKAFENHHCISEIVVVCQLQLHEKLQELIKKFGVRKKIIIAQAGETRQKSVFNGVKQCAYNTDYFMIHDGARPFVGSEMIDCALELAYKKKAVIVAVTSKDTVKICDNQNQIIETPQRNHTYLAQTPQIFCAKLYHRAMQQAITQQQDFTDDAQLIESIGIPVFISQGSYGNIKITTVDDVALAQIILEKERCCK
ncbi:MAG: 2-C-methyl-D-erythritol 4-phosphate cytidylyltransferase [Oscillospiraceae bacterium]